VCGQMGLGGSKSIHLCELMLVVHVADETK